MGCDLRLLPYDGDEETLAFSHTLLSCARSTSLLERILHLPSTPVPRHFRAYDVSGYGITPTTYAGDPLTWVAAAALVPFADDPDVQEVPTNRAIWAYLAQLPPETKVALYWH